MSGLQVPLQAQGQLRRQEGALAVLTQPWAGAPSGPPGCLGGAVANIDFGKHHFAPSARRGRGRPDPGAEAAAPHLDEAISSDRWLLRALRPLGAPK